MGTANTCRVIHKLAQIISTNIGLQAQGIQLFLSLDLRRCSTKIICIGERSGKVVEGCGISLGEADFGTAEVSFEILAHITEWFCGGKLWDAQAAAVEVGLNFLRPRLENVSGYVIQSVMEMAFLCAC